MGRVGTGLKRRVGTPGRGAMDKAGRGRLLSGAAARTLRGCAMLAWLSASWGCGDTGPTRYPVAGVVTYNGRPVPTGNVIFVPDEGPAAVTTIAEDGGYHLEAVAGRHRVGVTAIPEPPPGTDEGSYISPPPLVPSKFGRPSTSGIVVEVQSHENTGMDITLP